jgi:membrane protein DedA with SNARE-associated domain
MLVASIVSYLVSELHRLPSGLVYGLVALLVFGEAALFIGFVLPGETSVLVAGVVASQGRVNIVILCGLVVVAAIIGDSVGFEVGKRYGERLLTLRVFRRRRAALDRALIGLEKRGPAYVFIGRFTAFLRAVMPGLAGIAKMRYRRFLLANAAGGLVWGVSFTLLGYFAGNALTKIEKYASWGATTILVVLIVVVVTLHLRRKRKEAALEAAAEDRSAPGEH